MGVLVGVEVLVGVSVTVGVGEMVAVGVGVQAAAVAVIGAAVIMACKSREGAQATSPSSKQKANRL